MESICGGLSRDRIFGNKPFGEDKGGVVSLEDMDFVDGRQAFVGSFRVTARLLTNLCLRIETEGRIASVTGRLQCLVRRISGCLAGHFHK